jgi:hypothetical protein
MSLCAVLGALLFSSVPAFGAQSGAGLPDGRVYEMVTPPEGFDSETYQPLESDAVYSNTQTQFPFQAAADGDRVAFVGGPTVGGSEVSGYHGGNEYLGTRSTGGGWTQTNISPASAPSAVFEAFSSDLSVAFLDATEPLSSTAPGFGEAPAFAGNYDVLYSTGSAGGGYAPFFTVKPPYRPKESFRSAGALFGPGFNGGSGGNRAYNNRRLAFAGASADSSHLLFLANDALTGPSEGRPAAEGGSAGSYEEKDNLYESVGGQLRLVNVLPDATTHVNATFGGGPRFSHVISADGSRIFWTDLTTGHIYVRENGTTTVEVSPAGTYQTATSDGSVAFFTNGDLYEYEVGSAHTTDLTPGVPVQRVVGASENGEYVYYVTTGGEFALWHNGVTTTIAASPATRGEVTPDGHSVVFASKPELPGPISVYDADTGLVYCASCTTSGTQGVLPMTNHENVYQPRWISADGSRVFFDSKEGLVPQDSNGVLDVYEWERYGAGGCAESTGCVYLLSGGTSTEESYFADASENGDDVFIVTRAKLVGADDNELFDLYDARVGGVVPVASPSCTGAGCQGSPGAPPIFATPSSVTFEGVGNFPAPAQEAKVKPKKKPKQSKKQPKHRKKTKKSKARKSARKAGGRKRSGAKGGRS